MNNSNAMNKKYFIISAIAMCCVALFSSCTDDDDDQNDDQPKHSPYISKVFDFFPAPGQFVNQLPEYADGDTKADILAKVEKSVVGKKNGGLISLGGFGGYITFGFDHTIINVEGKRDIRIMANAFYEGYNESKGGSCEPGIIMVSYDANKNGIPDDEWYEIAGSEYHKSTTIKNYEITYYRPASEEGTPKEYIRWTDNQGQSGYKAKNTFHTQTYFPGWIDEETITFKGTLLPNNATNEGSEEVPYWVLRAYGHGYADNAPNTNDDSAIDISWAVDADGKKVNLPGVDFMKIHTGVNQEAGWIGEVSTDFSGAYDMHLLGESIDTVE